MYKFIKEFSSFVVDQIISKDELVNLGYSEDVINIWLNEGIIENTTEKPKKQQEIQ